MLLITSSQSQGSAWHRVNRWRSGDSRACLTPLLLSHSTPRLQEALKGVFKTSLELCHVQMPSNCPGSCPHPRTLQHAVLTSTFLPASASSKWLGATSSKSLFPALPHNPHNGPLVHSRGSFHTNSLLWLSDKLPSSLQVTTYNCYAYIPLPCPCFGMLT